METSDIISIIATLVTLGTAMAALYISCRGNKINQTQLKATLKIQEQAKNLDLYEKRISLLESIQSIDNGNPTVSPFELGVLFDKKVEVLYYDLILSLTKLKNKRKKLKEYFDLYEKNTINNCDSLSVQELKILLEEAQKKAEETNSYGYTTKYQDLCNQYQIIPEDSEKLALNYCSIQLEFEDIESLCYAKTNKLIEIMKKFIEKSLQSITEV